MELLGLPQDDAPIDLDFSSAMRAFYTELATYVNMSHSANFSVLVSPGSAVRWLLPNSLRGIVTIS